MNCGYCGKSFEEDRTQKACKACPLGSDCGLILCPHCGYENPGTPRWITFLKERFFPAKTSDAQSASAPRPGRYDLPVLDTPIRMGDRP